MAQDLIRFITAGSADDGKSTLIGRLLFDSRAVLADQVQTLSKARHSRVRAEDADFDLALLTDGLEAEREQGITIDVAYRYFTTGKRKFIVADAPGHEQYTRNMVTGASQSDATVILIDPTRLDFSVAKPNLLAQTKRHASIVRLLNLKHVVFVVNKMDLFGFSQEVFRAITAAVQELASTIGLPAPQLIPASALKGGNIVARSAEASWYQGPTLLEWLETIEDAPVEKNLGLRFPVQYVARQDGQAADDFRGYLGRIESGQIFKGQRVRVLPAGLETTIAEIHISSGSAVPPSAEGAVMARAGQSVVVTLTDDVDVSRGDLIVAALDAEDSQPTLTKKIVADLCWLDTEPLSLARKYLLQHATRTVYAKVQKIQNVLDIETLSASQAQTAVGLNDIGRVELGLQSAVAADLYEESQATGAFVLVDDATKLTVAAGMIRVAN
jgi:sulfate adenylyltransferase subunit 1